MTSSMWNYFSQRFSRHQSLAEDTEQPYESIPMTDSGTRSTPENWPRSRSLAQSLALSRAVALLAVLAAAAGWVYVLQECPFSNKCSDIATPEVTSCSPRFDAVNLQDLAVVNAISHNDHQRARPLMDALGWGLTAIEVDLNLLEDDELLMVGAHSQKADIERSFKKLYLDPLQYYLDKQNQNSEKSHRNGIFKSNPGVTVHLVLTLRGDGEDIFPVLEELLDPLHDAGYLTTFHPDSGKLNIAPLTISLSGNCPTLAILDMKHRFMFADAPLARLSETRFVNGHAIVWDKNMSPIASADLSTMDEMTRADPAKLRELTGKAHDIGLLVRLYGVPEWPRTERDASWQAQLAAGVDLISSIDLEALVKL